jgi:hypothetical protein
MHLLPVVIIEANIASWPENNEGGDELSGKTKDPQDIACEVFLRC